MSFVPTFVLATLLYFIGPSHGEIRVQHQTNINFKNITHILPHQDQIFLADNERIYILNTTLDIQSNVSTCTNNVRDCVNVMKIFLLDQHKDKLITCGSGNSGKCQIRNSSKIVQVTDESQGNVVSTESNKPATAILTPDNNVLIGSTYGQGFADANTATELRYAFPLSTRLTERSQSLEANRILQLQIKKDSGKTLTDYLIFFKGVLRSENFTYLVTNQKKHVESNEGYVSKLIRICDSDTTKETTSYRAIFNTYIDMEIKCEKDGITYNLIQDSIFVRYNNEFYFLGVFANSGDPENIAGSGAVCATKVSQITQNIQKIGKRFASCSTDFTENQRYFPNSWSVCPGNETVSCDPLENFKYILGDTPLTLTLLYVHDTTYEYLTKIKERKVEVQKNEEKLAILVGSSRGNLIQFNFMGIDHDLEKYDEESVHPGFPIIDFYETEESDAMFVASQRKFVKYSETTCSEFLTCEDTMKGRNPLCGWCVYEGKSTRKKHCSSQTHWLSALGQCVQISLDPKGQLVSDASKNVQISLEGLPGGVTDTNTYKCVYNTSSGEAIREVEATITGQKLTCTTPNEQSSSVILHLMVKRGSTEVLLASKEYEYYNCQTYVSCGACTSTSGICSWCTDTNTCIQTVQTSGCTQHKLGQKYECPQLDMTDLQYIPNDVEQEVELNTNNLDKNNGGTYKCVVQGESFVATEKNDSLTCTIKVSIAEGKKKEEKSISVIYEKGGKEVTLEDSHIAQVSVYRCDVLGKDCSHCVSVNATRYKCKWSSQQHCTHCGSNPCSSHECPAPTITTVNPNDGSYKGGTIVTIHGENLGRTVNDVDSVTLVGEPCTLKTSDFTTTDNEDYMNEVPTSVVCEVEGELQQGKWPKYLNNPGDVNITVSGNTRTKQNGFTFKVANISRIYPVDGPKIGGTIVTMYGTNLGIGNKNVIVVYNSHHSKFIDCKVFSLPGQESTIQCKTKALTQDMTLISLRMNGIGRTVSDVLLNFKVLDNPEIGGISPHRVILSGGTTISVTGDNLQNAHTKKMVLVYAGKTSVSLCTSKTQKTMECKVPSAPEQLRKDTNAINDRNKGTNAVNNRNKRRKRSDCNGCTEVQLDLVLDGVIHSFTLQYFLDPEFDPLNENGDVVIFKSGTEKLILKGSNLNLVVEEKDIETTVGLEKCVVVKLEESSLECIPPKEAPLGSKYSQVNVTIGNFRKSLGYLEYQKELDETLKKIGIIAGACAAGLIILVVIGVVFCVRKYRKMGQKAQQLNSELNQMEMEIKSVAKQEFFHMHSTMSGVNKSLVEQGFPYCEYQQYAFHTMFPADYMDNHPLLHEPVVSKGKVSDDTRLKLTRSMDSFEQLILNKFFLVSVIKTMEEQKKFFLKEKSNLAGNLCTILFGRMEYLQEVLGVLITNLVQESTGKRTSKTLFRRCESITEKLLNDWMFLCQYPNIKTSFGSPLYLMFKAMQLTIESGPIDSETSDSYYTLTEERLLRKWDNDTEEGGKKAKLEDTPLTLHVVVDSSQTITECKVLACDTITQVKRKCMTQIYVNYPASQFEVVPEELHLEWHEGFGGSLNLQDEDNTSVKDSEWQRVNTLSHYNVKDNSNMALIDPKAMDMGQENYVNLAQINIDPDNICNGSMDSTEPLTSNSNEESHIPLKKWHLVKPDSENNNSHKSRFGPLYLNRLFTTKQCILEYLKPLFDILLKVDMCPPTTRFLYSFLDDLAEKNRVEPDTLHQWKSHSYLIRVWAKLIKNPQVIFDVDVPDYVDSSMEVLSQVLIESCSLSQLKHTKDSPPQKLIFMNEVLLYRDRLKDFYKNAQATSQTPEELRQHLNEVNRLQNQCAMFNKMSALYRFYQQLQPYLDDILEDLETNKDTSGLHLDKKFQQIIDTMEEEL